MGISGGHAADVGCAEGELRGEGSGIRDPHKEWGGVVAEELCCLLVRESGSLGHMVQAGEERREEGGKVSPPPGVIGSLLSFT